MLAGECRLLVEGEERLLGPWDFFHSPAGTEHVVVGAGDGPCVVLMAGAGSRTSASSTRCRSSPGGTARAPRRRRPSRARRTRGSSATCRGGLRPGIASLGRSARDRRDPARPPGVHRREPGDAATGRAGRRAVPGRRGRSRRGSARSVTSRPCISRRSRSSSRCSAAARSCRTTAPPRTTTPRSTRCWRRTAGSRRKS